MGLQRQSQAFLSKPPADGEAVHRKGFQVASCYNLMVMTSQQRLAGSLRHGFHSGVIERPRPQIDASGMLQYL